MNAHIHYIHTLTLTVHSTIQKSKSQHFSDEDCSTTWIPKFGTLILKSAPCTAKILSKNSLCERSYTLHIHTYPNSTFNNNSRKSKSQQFSDEDCNTTWIPKFGTLILKSAPCTAKILSKNSLCDYIHTLTLTTHSTTNSGKVTTFVF